MIGRDLQCRFRCKGSECCCFVNRYCHADLTCAAFSQIYPDVASASCCGETDQRAVQKMYLSGGGCFVGGDSRRHVTHVPHLTSHKPKDWRSSTSSRYKLAQLSIHRLQSNAGADSKGAGLSSSACCS